MGTMQRNKRLGLPPEKPRWRIENIGPRFKKATKDCTKSMNSLVEALHALPEDVKQELRRM